MDHYCCVQEPLHWAAYCGFVSALLYAHCSGGAVGIACSCCDSVFWPALAHFCLDASRSSVLCRGGSALNCSAVQSAQGGAVRAFPQGCCLTVLRGEALGLLLAQRCASVLCAL
jgi:hypothetical protein